MAKNPKLPCVKIILAYIENSCGIFKVIPVENEHRTIYHQRHISTLLMAIYACLVHVELHVLHTLSNKTDRSL